MATQYESHGCGFELERPFCFASFHPGDSMSRGWYATRPATASSPSTSARMARLCLTWAVVVVTGAGASAGAPCIATYEGNDSRERMKFVVTLTPAAADLARSQRPHIDDPGPARPLVRGNPLLGLIFLPFPRPLKSRGARFVARRSHTRPPASFTPPPPPPRRRRRTPSQRSGDLPCSSARKTSCCAAPWGQCP